MRHRGPDQGGHWQHPSAPLFAGHQRLTILDASGGQQPMWSDDGNTGLVYNGEIYNNAELRTELERRGHVFRSRNSDTETVLRGYVEWGDQLPTRLNGMFAFCIIDRNRRKLVLARDRHGEKPLYWGQQGHLFIFASELSAIAAHSHFSPTLNQKSLQKLVLHAFMPAPNTILDNCFKLKAGHVLHYDWTKNTTGIRPYWTFAIQPDDAFYRRREADIADEFRNLFTMSVKRRLMSDVPLGFLLSGGVDSSALVAAASRLLPSGQISAFTMGFSERSFDERKPASDVARHFGIDHHIKTMDTEMFGRDAASILSRLDEPVFDPSIIPTSAVFQLASEHVKVVLSGDGGDELLGGYDPFIALRPASVYAACIPPVIHRLISGIAEKLPKSHANMSLDFKIRKTLSALQYPKSYWNPVWLGAADAQMLPELFSRHYPLDELFEEVLAAWEENRSGSTLDKSLEFYTRFYLPDNILTKVDRASMMWSTESRSSFLDNDLVDFCARLPARYKIRNGNRKYLLKRAFRDLLPDFVTKRPKKGFGMPVSAWIKSGIVTCPDLRLDGVNSQMIARIRDRHASGKSDMRQLLWGWHVLAHNKTLANTLN